MNSEAFFKNGFPIIDEKIPTPSMLKISKDSFNSFFQRFESKKMRKYKGLEYVLKEYFEDAYLGYALGVSNSTPSDCILKNTTYAIPLFVYLKHEKSIYRVFLLEVPLITKQGTFIVNGIENTIVNQLIRDSNIYSRKNDIFDIQKSIVIRGIKGRAIQIDLFRNYFIGRKHPYKILKKKERLEQSHQNIFSTLNLSSLSFSDIASMLTIPLLIYKNTPSGLYLNYDWSSLNVERVIEENEESVLKKIGLGTKYGNNIDKAEYFKIINSSIKSAFITDITAEKYKDYVFIDIYNKNGTSVFQNIDSGVVLEKFIEFVPYLGSIIDLKKNSHFNSIIKSIRKEHSLFFVFIKKSKIISSFYLLLQKLFRLKQNRLLKKQLTTKFDHSVSNIWPDISLTNMGRLRINALLGSKHKELFITSRDIPYIIRYLLQLNKNIVNNDNFREQDLHTRRFSAIGELLSTCLQETLSYTITRNKQKENILFEKVNNCKRAFSLLFRFLYQSSLCQYTEQTNLLTYTTHPRKLSLMGPGGLKNDNVSLEMRDVHASSYGRVCPIETPEGKSVGVVTNLALFSRLNRDYQIETPFVFVDKGIVTEKIHFLSTMEERYHHVALFQAKKQKNGSLFSIDGILCRYQDQIIKVDSKKINYIEASSFQLTSLPSGMIPFLEHNDANRALMGANMQRQAVPLENIESAIVCTGKEVSNSDLFSFIDKQKKQFCFRDKFSSINYQIMYPSVKNYTQITGIVDYVAEQTRIINKDYLKITNQKTVLNYSLNTPLETNKNRNIVLNGYHSNKEFIHLGHNLLVAFTSLNGHTYEDSIVVSERLLQSGFLKSTHAEIYKAVEQYESNGQELLVRTHKHASLDYDGVINTGSIVYKDNILISKERRQLVPMGKDKLVVSDKSIKYKNNAPGYVLQKVKFFEDSSNNFIYRTSNTNYQSLMTYTQKQCTYYYSFIFYLLQNNTAKDKVILHTSSIATLLYTFSNKKLYWYLFLVSPCSINRPLKQWSYLFYIISFCFFKRVFPIKKDLFNILRDFSNYYLSKSLNCYLLNKQKKHVAEEKHLLNTKKKDANINNTEQFFLDRYLFLHYLELVHSWLLVTINTQVRSFLYCTMDQQKSVLYRKSIKQNRPSLKMAKVITITRHNLQVGDKLTGRYGNKGVISRILSIDNMPYLKDGTSVDVVLSPLGVSSRMNIGQLLETTIGFVNVHYGKQIQSLMLNKMILNTSNMRLYLQNLFPHEYQQIIIRKMSSEALNQLLYKISHGLVLNTPTFQSIKDSSIEVLSRKAALTYSKKLGLIDGYTGELLENNVTVGYMYVMKLNHLVDNKIHGRSTGPYNVVTQQASKGKSKNGGQRLGEMEVWALQSYGAAYTLQEMLTFKSDSTIARTHFLQQFIKGKLHRLDLPRTFRLLRDELRVLGIELSFIVRKHTKN